MDGLSSLIEIVLATEESKSFTFQCCEAGFHFLIETHAGASLNSPCPRYRLLDRLQEHE